LGLEKTNNKDYSVDWNEFIQTGSKKALSVIYLEHFDRLYSYGKKLTRHELQVEDAIQNLFTYLLRNRKKLRMVRNVRAYLMASFHHELFRLIRVNKNPAGSPEIMEENGFAPEYSIEDEIVKEESDARLRKILIESLRKLTPRQQEILYLKFDNNLSYEEISGMFGISAESCRTSVYRSIRSIRDDLKKLQVKGIQLFTMVFRK
jgi:RNA polymerase sigma factor (sigma-70 family)